MEKLFSVKEVARFADVYEATVYTAIRRGQIQPAPITGRIAIDSSELARWMNARGRWPKKQEKTTNEN